MEAKILKTLRAAVIDRRRALTRQYADAALLWLEDTARYDDAEHEIRQACDLLDELKDAERYLNSLEGVANGT